MLYHSGNFMFIFLQLCSTIVAISCSYFPTLLYNSGNFMFILNNITLLYNSGNFMFILNNTTLLYNSGNFMFILNNTTLLYNSGNFMFILNNTTFLYNSDNFMFIYIFFLTYIYLREHIVNIYNYSNILSSYTPFSFTYPCTFSQKRDSMQLYI